MEDIENANMKKEDVLFLAKKALVDIGHWEDFKIKNGRFFSDNDPLYNFNHWIVWFNFTKDDWNNGEVTPTLIIDDVEKLVVNVSWKKSVFPLTYDKQKDKYYHHALSR